MTILQRTGVIRRLPIPMALLNERVDIQAPSSTPDGQGGYTDTFTTIATGQRAIILDAKARSKNTGSESLSLGAYAEHVTHHVYLRYDVTGLIPGCRVVWGSRYLRVHNVDHQGGNPLMWCEEIRG